MAASVAFTSQASLKAAVARPVGGRRSRTAFIARAEAAGADTEGGKYLRSLPGISQPFPDVFDPAGLSKDQPIKELRRWRESEIVHGRVAMLAALGFVVGEQLQDFPLFFNFDGQITGPAINHFQQTRQGFWEPLVLAIGIAESYRVAVGWATPVDGQLNTLRTDYNMGDLGFDPLGVKPTDPEELKVLQTKELNNGRLAMIAIAGFVAQELVLQDEIFEHLAVRLCKEAALEVVDIEEIPEKILKQL